MKHFRNDIRVSRNISKMCKSFEIKVKDKLKDVYGNVSITTDELSSGICRGYFTTILHWIDDSWITRKIVLDLDRLQSPHKEEETSTMLLDVLSKWNLTSKLQAIRSDSVSDMVVSMKLLTTSINKLTGTFRSVEDIHVRCTAHVVNLCVKDCLPKVHEKIRNIRDLLSAIRSSVNRRDILEKSKNHLRISNQLPSLDVKTRW